MMQEICKVRRVGISIAFIWGVLLAYQVIAAETNPGMIEYNSKCASCHGPGGAGDGVIAPALRVKPPDLRQLSKNNGGQFPQNYLINVIDGRKSLRSHGNYEMPVWGKELQEENSTSKPNEKITAIVEYIRTIQN